MDYDALEKVFDFANGAFAAQVALLQVMIGTGAIDGEKIKFSLRALIADLKPEEREQPYGLCLSMTLTALETGVTPSLRGTMH